VDLLRFKKNNGLAMKNLKPYMLIKPSSQ